jgi:chromosome partitioning protein
MLVCFASEKGGVGKTTVAALLAERFTTLGVPVRLADGDRQASLAAVAEVSNGRLPPAEEVRAPDFPALAAREGLTFLDLPSGIGVEFNTALSVAHHAIIPVAPSAFDLRTLPATLAQVRRAQELRGGSPRALIVPNKIDLREPTSKELLAALARLGWSVSQTWLLERSVYRRMGAAGLGALPRAARRNADDEVAGLADEVLEVLGIAKAAPGSEAA